MTTSSAVSDIERFNGSGDRARSVSTGLEETPAARPNGWPVLCDESVRWHLRWPVAKETAMRVGTYNTGMSGQQLRALFGQTTGFGAAGTSERFAI